MMSFNFSGAGVALVTPFKDDLKIDFDALAKIVENQIAGGMDYLVALGTTAETPTLDDDEKKEIVSLITKTTNGRVPVIAGLSGNDTRAVLRKMESFYMAGVSGFLSVTPYYNRPNQEGLYRHFREFALHTPLPVILYNVPVRTGVNLEADTVVRLSELSDKIVAVKEASGNIAQITRIIKNAPSHFKVISGDDIMALPIIAVGGKGVISVIANALPETLSSMIHFALAGDFDKARNLHLELSNLMALQFLDGNPAGIKCMLHCQDILRDILRLPLIPACDRTRELIINELKKFT